MASWRLAKSLITLRDQVNKKAPRRSKRSDGTIGDAAHRARRSDHNPSGGIVRALDLTHDPANGFDAHVAARIIAAAKDPRFGYIISNGQIWSPDGRGWRKYTGSNPHTLHAHFSVHKNVDSTALWNLDGALPATPPPAITPMEPALSKPALRKGSKGDAVRELQTILAGMGFYKGKIDGDYGPLTEKAVHAFQKSKGLGVGYVGPYTWKALLPDAGAPATVPPPETKEPVPPTQGEYLESWYEPGYYPAASDYAEAWCMTFEKFEPLPYNDAGTLAQGFGHNAASGIPPIPVPGAAAWSREYAIEVMRKDLAMQVHYLKAYAKVPLLQRHVDALALDLFQMGPGNWKRDKVLERLNAKDYAGAAQAMRDRADIKGLDRRRRIQADIMDGKRPDTKAW